MANTPTVVPRWKVPLLAALGAVLVALSFGPGPQAGAEMPKAGDKPPKISLSQWVGEPADWKGKVLLMEFWATWCPPCRKSIPHLNEIWEKYKDQGLMVVGVSNESAQTIKSFQHEIPMKYPVAISTSLARDYGVEGIPQAFIIGRDGKVLWAGHPMELNDSIVENALKESAPAPAGSAPSDAK